MKLVKGGRVVDPASGHDGRLDLLVANGTIARAGVGLEEPGAEVVDATGLVIVPGLVDLHAHVGVPGREHREDLRSASRAARRGGFTSLLVYPEGDPPVDHPEAVRSLLRQAEAEAICRIYVAAALTQGREGRQLNEVALLKEAGASALTDARPIDDAGLLRRGLWYAGMCGLPLLLPCGEPSLETRGVMHEGAVSTRLGLEGLPAVAEEIGVARAILLARDTGRPIHLGPISTAGAVRQIEEAKALGIPVTAETTFHHLVLTEEAVGDFEPHTKVKPPLRTEADRDALVDAVARGIIDCIVTDHTPYSLEETEVEWVAAPFGIAGLETAVGLSVTYLIATGRMGWLQWAGRVSRRPAEILGIPGGSLGEGQPADLTFIDPEQSWTVDTAEFASQARNNPFHGWTLKGRVVDTWVAGESMPGGEGV